MSRDRLRLLHIRDALRRIESYTTTRERFFSDPMMQDAVVRNLEIIGEAVKHLTPTTTAARPDLPWPQIAAMRDRLIHGYFSVDLELVWDVVSDELRNLAEAVEQMIASNRNS